jgi:hypothetical protein
MIRHQRLMIAALVSIRRPCRGSRDPQAAWLTLALSPAPVAFFATKKPCACDAGVPALTHASLASFGSRHQTRLSTRVIRRRLRRRTVSVKSTRVQVHEMSIPNTAFPDPARHSVRRRSRPSTTREPGVGRAGRCCWQCRPSPGPTPSLHNSPSLTPTRPEQRTWRVSRLAPELTSQAGDSGRSCVGRESSRAA